MKLWVRSILLLGTAFLFLFSNLAGALSIKSERPRILVADFGLFNPPRSGKPFFTPAKVVPLTPGQNFGWVMLIRTDKPKVKWREELILPEKPATWGIPENIGTRSISEDGRIVTTEREVSTIRGVILNIWGIAEGDPKGRHVIRVSIEGGPARTFEFEVQ